MDNKEKNFVSAIVCIGRDSYNAIAFFDEMERVLSSHFSKYEIVVVNDSCDKKVISELKEWATTMPQPLTILHMSLEQSWESCMSAALDLAIGDFIFEFDNPELPCDADMVFRAYEKALEGNDIVSVCPSSQRMMSRLFYALFNRSSLSAYPIRTDIFRVVSRRAVNRVQAVSSCMPYRKAAYAASGLKSAILEIPGKISPRRHDSFRLAVEALLLYTNCGYMLGIVVTLAMMLVALSALVYTIVVFLTGKPVEGWTTTMLVLTFGFASVFAIMTAILKYLSLILGLVFRRQQYLIENIEKIQK